MQKGITGKNRRGQQEKIVEQSPLQTSSASRPSSVQQEAKQQPKSILKKRDTSLAVPNRKSLVKAHSLEMEDAYAIPHRVTKAQLQQPLLDLPPKKGRQKAQAAVRSSTPPTPVRANRGHTNGTNKMNKQATNGDEKANISLNSATKSPMERRQMRREREVLLTPTRPGSDLGDKMMNSTMQDGRPKSFMKKLFLMQ